MLILRDTEGKKDVKKIWAEIYMDEKSGVRKLKKLGQLREMISIGEN